VARASSARTLAEALRQRGIRVVVLDNLSLGSLRNLDWCRGDDELEFVKGDIRDERLLAKVVPGCDWVFHQSALPSCAVLRGHAIGKQRPTIWKALSTCW